MTGSPNGLMRAGRMIGQNEMVCEETPIPDARDGELLVKTEMASICGSDLHVVCMGSGGAHTPPCPHGYPGHEAIGEVIASNDPSVAEGTQVLCAPNVPVSEGFSEYQRIGAPYAIPLPETDVSRPELLMGQQLGTVIYAMRQHPQDVVGKTVMVMGQGSAGLFFTYLLKRAGAARVIVADLSDARLAVAKQYGADVAINAGTDDAVAAVADLTDGVGADYLVEAVGRRNTFHQSVDLVRVGASMLWFGLPDSDDSISISFAKFFRKKLSAASTYGAQDEGDRVSFKAALDLIARREIDVSPLLSHIYPIEEINTAFATANEPIEEGALKVSVSF